MRKRIKENLSLTKDNIITSASEKIHENDIFFKFNIELKEYEKYEIEIIYSKELISKYKKKTFVLVRETPDIYDSKVKPYIEAIPGVKFIQNILHKGTEPLVADWGDFVLVTDYKYKSPFDHYYLCLIRGDLRSIRDLNTKSLQLLTRVRSAKADLEDKFGLQRGQLQAFLHYYPSFYHLHFHFVDLNLDNLSNKINRAFDLDDIIDNLTIDGDYYKEENNDCDDR